MGKPLADKTPRIKTLSSLDEIKSLDTGDDRLFLSATHEEIKQGATTDIYFVKTQEILGRLGLGDKMVTAEIFARRNGVFSGLRELKNLLSDRDLELWTLVEGESFSEREVVARIKGSYAEFGIYETAVLGILASSCGWATAAKEAKEAAGGAPVSVFGARHLHPAVAPVMEHAAVMAGVDSSSCVLGAKLAGMQPSGTTPHAFILIMGDTLLAARAYDEIMPKDAPRIVLADTFKDEAEEALRLAENLGALDGVRLDTPGERGGVSAGLVREVRARLDQAGYTHVAIFVSGGLTPDRIRELKEAGASAFGVGSYISGARAIDMTMDIKEIDGLPIAKRGRIPGIMPSPRLKKVL